MYIANVTIPNYWIKLETLIKAQDPTFVFDANVSYRLYANTFEPFWIIDLVSGSTPSGNKGKVIRRDTGSRFVYNKGAGVLWVKSYSGILELEIESNA